MQDLVADSGATNHIYFDAAIFKSIIRPRVQERAREESRGMGKAEVEEEMRRMEVAHNLSMVFMTMTSTITETS